MFKCTVGNRLAREVSKNDNGNGSMICHHLYTISVVGRSDIQTCGNGNKGRRKSRRKDTAYYCCGWRGGWGRCSIDSYVNDWLQWRINWLTDQRLCFPGAVCAIPMLHSSARVALQSSMIFQRASVFMGQATPAQPMAEFERRVCGTNRVNAIRSVMRWITRAILQHGFSESI